MVILEAMASGLPIVGTYVEGIPEVIENEKEGLLVRPGSPDEIASAIRRVTNNPVDARKMADAARARQREHFSDISMARGVAAVYDDLGISRKPN